MVSYSIVFLSDKKMGFIICLFLPGLLVFCDGLHVLGPSRSDPLIVELGGSVMLPCYVEAPIPVEELEVEWRRTDSETLVHLFQDGESRTEAQDQVYSGRASFFTGEVERGNFSLLLTNLETKDAGVYRCSVFRLQETGQTSVEIEYLIVTGGHAVSSFARGDVTLNCSVDSRIPPKELEAVSWKKEDQDIAVLVFQEGAVQPDFTHQRFRDRVEFFSDEEIRRGNFSLRIKDLRMEDKGLYRCEVFAGELSANTTVGILQLGFSHVHYVILVLCGLTCFCGSFLFLGCIPFIICKKHGSRTVIIQNMLVLSPNILMCLAFVLWGVLEGFLSDAVTCLTINLLRMLWILLFSPLFDRFQDKIQSLIKTVPVLEYLALSVIVALVLGLHGWRTQDKGCMASAGLSLVFSIIIYLAAVLDEFLSFKTWRNLTHVLTFVVGGLHGLTSFIIIIILFATPDVIETNGNKGLICLIILLMCVLILAFTVTARYDNFNLDLDYLKTQLDDLNRTRDDLKAELDHFKLDQDDLNIELDNFNLDQDDLNRTQDDLKAELDDLNRTRDYLKTELDDLNRRQAMMFVPGVAVLFIVNSVTLIVNLISQAGEGEHTVEDLRLILLPFEMAFVIICSFTVCCSS